MIMRSANREIAWSCDACGDDGVIHGWAGSPADLSTLDDSYVEGDAVALLIARDLFAVLWDVLQIGDAGELLVARAEGHADGVVLAGRTGAFEELVECVAAEANAEANRRRMRLLDEACAALEQTLAPG